MQAVAYAPLDLATRVEGSTRRTPADVGVTTGRPVYQRQPEADAIALRRELVGALEVASIASRGGRCTKPFQKRSCALTEILAPAAVCDDVVPGDPRPTEVMTKSTAHP
jgi:hypothetical protein